MPPGLHISITPNPQTVQPDPMVPLYQYGDDVQVLGGVRGCASGGCPAVMVLQDAPDTWFDRQRQYFLYAINPGMSLSAIIALMGDNKALMNHTGFGDESDPRANYLTGNNLSSPNPRLDKLRTFALNTHTGTEVYSLTIALLEIVRSVRARSFMALRSALQTGANALEVRTFDGNSPPPLAPGNVYRSRLEDVRLDDYLITPQKNREMFLDCTNVHIRAGGFVAYGPFANGSVRDWIGDGKMHSFFPLVSRSRIVSPLRNWRKVTAFPSPFRQ